MKVYVYLEWDKIIKTGGVRTAYKNRLKACRYGNIEIANEHDDFDILQLEFPGPFSLIRAINVRKKGKKVVMGTHITAEDFRETFVFGRKFSPHLKKYLRYVYSSADALISPSVYTRDLVISYGIDIPVYVLSNGIDPEFIRNARMKKSLNDDITIGCVGFVTKRKGITTFANLAKKFPEYTFRWVGEIRRNLLFDVEKLKKIPNLQFTGYVDDVRSEYEKFDIFLFPSHEENQGIVLLEAAAYGLPLIVRDIPAYRGWLKHGENCMKCPTEYDFEENLKMVIEDEDLRKRLSANSRKLAEQHSLDKIGKELRKIYEEVLDMNFSM